MFIFGFVWVANTNKNSTYARTCTRFFCFSFFWPHVHIRSVAWYYLSIAIFLYFFLFVSSFCFLLLSCCIRSSMAECIALLHMMHTWYYITAYRDNTFSQLYLLLLLSTAKCESSSPRRIEQCIEPNSHMGRVWLESIDLGIDSLWVPQRSTTLSWIIEASDCVYTHCRR